MHFCSIWPISTTRFLVGSNGVFNATFIFKYCIIQYRQVATNVNVQYLFNLCWSMQIKLPNIRGKTTRNESAGRALHRVSNGSMDLSRGVQTAVTRLKGICLNRLTRSQTGRRSSVIYSRDPSSQTDLTTRESSAYTQISLLFLRKQLGSGCQSRTQQCFDVKRIFMVFVYKF